MKKLITTVPFLLATLVASPDAHAYHSFNGTFHTWWSDLRPNVILVNNSGETRFVSCGSDEFQQIGGDGKAWACNNPASITMIATPGPSNGTAGIAVYYCTAQLECEQSG